MTAVNEPRNTRNGSRTESNNASRDAALRGALRAFAGPHANPPALRPSASRTLSSLHTVAYSHDRRPKTSYNESPSHGSSVVLVTPSSTLPSTSASSHSTSTGRPATATAASRFSRNNELPSHDTVPEKFMGTGPRGLDAHVSNSTLDALPSVGTVHGTKDYFESMHTASRLMPELSKSGTSTIGLQNTIASAHPRPQLSVDVGAAVARSQGASVEIQSPKPIRPSAGARPLEQLTDGSTDEAFAEKEVFSTPAEDSINLPTMQSLADNQPAPPPPERDIRKLSATSDSRPSASNISSTQTVRLTPVPLSASMAYSMRPCSAESHLTRSKRGSPHAGSTEQANAHRIDSLANAMVASHLASSRAPSRAGSPGKAMKPLLPRRATDHPSVLHPGMAFHLSKQDSRTPSPKKGIRQTMRKPRSPVDLNAELADKHKRSHFRMRKHPHKHKEGDRKRWRDEITETERKRYDGLWAANRDLHVSLVAEELQPYSSRPQTDGYVSGLVVRDIWSRSRLPAHVLEEIWELVDTEGVGRLSREAFVVGVWLVDQRLKGRKLPVKVGESVWHSARGIYGLKMPRIKS